MFTFNEPGPRAKTIADSHHLFSRKAAYYARSRGSNGTARQQQRKKEKDELHQDAFIAFFNVAGANS